MDGWAVVARDRNSGETWKVAMEAEIDDKTAAAEIHAIPVTGTEDAIDLGVHEPNMNCVCRPAMCDGVLLHKNRKPN